MRRDLDQDAIAEISRNPAFVDGDGQLNEAGEAAAEAESLRLKIHAQAEYRRQADKKREGIRGHIGPRTSVRLR